MKFSAYEESGQRWIVWTANERPAVRYARAVRDDAFAILEDVGIQLPTDAVASTSALLPEGVVVDRAALATTTQAPVSAKRRLLEGLALTLVGAGLKFAFDLLVRHLDRRKKK